MANAARRVDLGFQGGQTLALRISDDEYTGLRKALEHDPASRWHEVKTQDSDVAVDLSQVVYVRLDTEDHKVGF